MHDNDTAILIVSCDAFSDLWLPVITSLRQHWQECPYKIYLSSNYLMPDFYGVTVLAIGEDVSWSDNLRLALTRIEENNVLLHIDDLIHYNNVDFKGIKLIFNWFSNSEANYVRCHSTHLIRTQEKQLVRPVAKGNLYRISTQFSLWNKNTLLSLLRPGENAWEFELLGSERADAMDGIYVTTKNYFSFVNGVIKGKWDIRALKKIHSSGIYPDLTSRKLMKYTDLLILRIKEFRHIFIMSVIPAQYSRIIKKILLRNKFCTYTYEKK